MIGGGLILTNQWSAIFADAAFSIPAAILSFVTPFVVISVSQALGVRAFFSERPAGGGRTEGFSMTVFSHGIPRRASFVAPLVGVAVTAIIAGLAWLEAGDPFAVPAAQIAQVFVLLFAFGLISQAAAYRRAAGA